MRLISDVLLLTALPLSNSASPGYSTILDIDIEFGLVEKFWIVIIFAVLRQQLSFVVLGIIL